MEDEGIEEGQMDIDGFGDGVDDEDGTYNSYSLTSLYESKNLCYLVIYTNLDFADDEDDEEDVDDDDGMYDDYPSK